MYTPLKSQSISLPNTSLPHNQIHNRVECATVEHLDLSKLENFEVVNHQYHQQGIQFKNAIALHPSNPAFPTRTSQSIVIGGPKTGTIDLIFSPPVHTADAYVTSSAVTTMVAFDHQDNVLSKDETLGRNLADKRSNYSANLCLSVQATANRLIHRIRLRCGGGQLALADLSFSRTLR